ncbi:hypothetical protein LC564_08415 [Fusobacterium animalis]
MNRRNYGDSLVNLVDLQKQLLPKNPATPALVGCQSWEVQSMAHLLINPSRATICVVLTALGVNYIVGKQYLSILLAGKTFKPIYDKLNLHSKNLSRTLEDAGTVINPLVSWGVCGVFVTSVLGVPTLTYLPFSFFCYLCIILTVISGFTGISITKNGDPNVA